MPREPRQYYVYIMASLSGTLYAGVTSTLRKRVFQHRFQRLDGFTNTYDVVRLLYWESYDEVHHAIGREKQLVGEEKRRSRSLNL